MTVSPYPTRGVVTAASEAALYSDPDVFPLLSGREFVASKASTWSTKVNEASAGREVRIGFWSSPRWRFKIKHEFLRNLAAKPEVAQLLGFFNQRFGKLGFFFYLDQEDYAVVDENIGTGDGATTVFQLARTSGGFQEPVYALWNNPVVKVNGVVNAAWTISPFGVLTFTSAPANGHAVTWSGSFLYVCRFDSDELDIEQLARQLWSQSGFPFITLKP